ncbi:hypothetical protein AB9P05_24190 [Roseivirga sp. BDSF3-8]|uniref:hypothetical protein n=1 Tax=Roseivirga sp. BDSF3-8 TaxID=3241598 RepID=UPI00353221E5
MEDIETTSVMIGSVVTWVGNTLARDKSVKKLFGDLSEATVNWIRPLLLEPGGSEKEEVKKLKEKPDSPARQKSLEAILEMAVEDNPEGEKHLRQLYKELCSQPGAITISHSKNVNTGTITSTSGNIQIGDSH